MERDLTGMRAYAEELFDNLESLQSNLGRFQQEMAALSVTRKSPDGQVTVTVGARGEVRDIVFDPRIYRRPDSKALGRLVTETIRAASADASARLTEMTRRFAPGTELDTMLSGDLTTRLSRFEERLDPDAGGRHDR